MQKVKKKKMPLMWDLDVSPLPPFRLPFQTVGWGCRTDTRKRERDTPPNPPHHFSPASPHHSSHLSSAHKTALPETRRFPSIRSQNHQQSLGMILTVSHPTHPPTTLPTPPPDPTTAEPAGRPASQPVGRSRTSRAWTAITLPRRRNTDSERNTAINTEH